MASVTQHPATARKDTPAELGLHRRLDLDETLAALRRRRPAHRGGRQARARRRAHRARHARSCIRSCWSRTRSSPTPQAGQAAQPRSADAMAGAARRAAVPEDRSDEDRRRRGDAGRQPRLRAALPHPAGRGARPMQVVFATSEPFDTRWIADLGHILRRDIKRVVANPLDIGRYLVEFYKRARSIQRAQGRQERPQRRPRRSSTSSSWSSSARHGSSTPTTSTSCTSSTGCGSTRSTSARRDIHLEPRRDTGIDPLPHRRRAAPGLPDADAGDDRDDRAHQAARPHGRGREAPAAGRPHQDAHRRTATRSSCACRRMPTAFGEKLVMRIFDPDIAGQATSPSSASRRTTAKRWERAGRAAARHHPGHRPDRLGQDDDALFDAEAAGDAGGQRLHGRGPDRDDRARVQPDAGAAGDRPRFRRPACAR